MLLQGQSCYFLLGVSLEFKMWNALYKDYLSIWAKQIEIETKQYNTVLFHLKFVYLLFIILFLNFCDIIFCDKTYRPSVMHSWNIFFFEFGFFLSDRTYGPGPGLSTERIQITDRGNQHPKKNRCLFKLGHCFKKFSILYIFDYIKRCPK